jgi:hypothetical protein
MNHVTAGIRSRTTWRERQTLSEWSLRQPTLLKQWTVHLPGQVHGAVVSSGGDRIAWLLVPAESEATRRAMSASIWTSDLDSSHLREIGSVAPIGRCGPSQEIRLPWQVRWAPDGKRIGFLYRDALYVVPVD